jgi:hypothetical protein
MAVLARIPHKSAPGNASDHQHRRQRETGERERHRPAMQTAEPDERSRGCDDQSRPLEADGGDQQADPRRDGMLQRRRNRGNQLLAEADAGSENENEAGDRHGTESDLPWHLHAEDDGVGEKEVVTHRRRHGDRVVGQQRHERRRKRGRQAGGDEHRTEIHAGGTEDDRLHEDDIGHRQKRGDAGERFCPDGGAVGGELETGF